MKFTIIVAKITLDKLSLVITMKNGTRAIHAIIDIPGIGKERTNKNDDIRLRIGQLNRVSGR